MFTRALITTLFILFSFAHLTLAGTRDPNTSDDKYLDFGKQFPSVLRFRALAEITDKKTGKKRLTFQFGSAVVIKSHWVLTAAHLTKNAEAHAIVKDNGDVYELTKIITPKEYDEDKIGFYDLSLCYSPKDFQLEFYTPLYKTQDEVGKPMTIAGYGLTGTFHTGCNIVDGKKRAGHNKVEGSDRAVLICTPTAGRARMPLEYMIAPGDSGGGMFIGNELAGINSFLMADDKHPDGTYGDESAFTRVSLYADWVESQIENYELAMAARATTGGDVRFEVSDVALNIQDESVLVLP